MHPQIEIFGALFPTYFVYLSCLFSCLIFPVYFRAPGQQLDQKIILNILIVIFVSGFIGARLLHILWENVLFYVRNPWASLYFWQGGYVYYGGFILAVVSTLLYLGPKKFLKYGDYLAPYLALSYGLGRGACLLAGCCYGAFCDLPWAISGRHPTQLYALVWELLILAILLIYQKNLSKVSGQRLLVWFLLHGMGRLFMENFRGDFRGGLILGWTISTWISWLLILVSMFSLFRLRLHARLQ
jgi:phosphatidylglycerol:prolipoprotein diacylglycerol transferase